MLGWPWCFGLAVGVVAFAKWMIGRDHAGGPVTAAWYAWPGMHPEQFYGRVVEAPTRDEVVWTLAQIGVGVIMLWGVVPRLKEPELAVSVGLIGLGLVMHFGVLRLASILFRARGFDARPLFDRPYASRSLGEFWGRRWNRGFTDAVTRWIFRPLRRRIGALPASAAVFAASGVGHDALLSVPAGGGYGGGSAYFGLQWLGIALERRRPSRVRTFAFVLIPIPLLFHQPFRLHVFHPFLQSIGATS